MLWVLTGLSIVGVILNLKRKRAGFLFWIGTNGVWAAFNFYKNIPEQGVLFTVYLMLAVWGYIEWGREHQAQ